MGGCNSVLNDIELGGAFVGAGIASAASGGIAAAGAVAGAGAAGAYFATKKGCSKSKTAIVDVTNSIVASAIVLSVENCGSNEIATQSIKLTCKPDVPEGQVYEQNPACRTCNAGVFEGMLAQHALERKLWDQGQEVTIRLPINEEYALMLGRIGTCGVNSCKACALANVTQANILNGNSNCYDQLRSQANFRANLTDLVQEQLVNNQDVLSGVAQAFGAQGVNSLTDKIVNQISTQVTDNFLNQVVSRMTATQDITLEGASISTNNISQYSAYNIALQQVTENDIVTNSISDAVFDTVARVANEQNTLNDVGEVVFEATVDFTKAVNNTVGQVMIAVLVVLGVTVVAIVGYALYKAFRKFVKADEELKRKRGLQQSNQTAFTQF